MAGNVPTDEKGRHGFEGATPDHKHGWDPEKVHLLPASTVVDLLQTEIEAIVSRCNEPSCGASALMVHSRPDGTANSWHSGSDIPDLLFCPLCGKTFFKVAVVELRPLLRVLGRCLDQHRREDELDPETRQRLKTLWYRGE